MLAAFGVDVLDPRTSVRRIWVLLNRLPPSARELDAPWRQESHLLAAIYDQLSYLTYVTLRAHGSKSAKMPKPLPRPTDRRQPAGSAQGKPRIPWAALGARMRKMAGVVTRE